MSENVVKKRKTSQRPGAKSSPATLTMGPGLDIKDVESGRQKLLAALAGASSLTVDLGSITSIDTAGIQLLLALRREADKRRISLHFVGESASVGRALSVLGLHDQIRVSSACA